MVCVWLTVGAISRYVLQSTSPIVSSVGLTIGAMGFFFSRMWMLNKSDLA
jgi:hypothetical protein